MGSPTDFCTEGDIGQLVELHMGEISVRQGQPHFHHVHSEDFGELRSRAYILPHVRTLLWRIMPS